MLRGALLFLLVGSSSCSSTAVDEHGASWVWILTGPRDAEVVGQARDEAFAGHFANMGDLREAGDLLVAGPLGEPKARTDHRGVFVLNTADRATAESLASTDPAARAGIFRFEIEPLTTDDALERLPALHAAALEAAGITDPPPGYHCRSYVLAAGSPVDAAAEVARRDGVLFAGTLGSGDDRRVILCLDAETVEQATAWLGETGELRWTLMPWFGTEEIARLRAGDR